MQTKKIQLATACAITALALFLTGCSGGSDSQGSSGGGNSQGSGGDKRSTANDCLREKGAEITEPARKGDLAQINPGTLSQEELAQAMKDCDVMGGKGAGAGISQEMKDKALDYAECMRKEGLDFPDPEFGNGGTKAQKIPQGDEAAFAAADKVCAAKTG
ncbi:hypothetical protein [Streptomyces sp. 029-5]|uniref:hypothetical protein n=1 Tax=Streptomyces sp. 029-5 TaxID=2789261 RepID=UPI0039815332